MTTYQDGTIRPGYFDIRINHKPIEETDCDRNIHQLYAENLLLERELAERNARIEELQRELQQLRSTMTIGANTQIDYATDDDAQVNTDVDTAEMDTTIYPDTKGPMTMAELSENDKAPMSMAEWEGNRTIAQLS
jgi:hypothetical protein